MKRTWRHWKIVSVQLKWMGSSGVHVRIINLLITVESLKRCPAWGAHLKGTIWYWICINITFSISLISLQLSWSLWLTESRSYRSCALLKTIRFPPTTLKKKSVPSKIMYVLSFVYTQNLCLHTKFCLLKYILIIYFSFSGPEHGYCCI